MPDLSRTLFDGLRRAGLDDLAQRLADLTMRMLLVRFRREPATGHGSYLDQALRYMEEPTMLERAITEWRDAALAEGKSLGRSEGMREGRADGVREGRAEGARAMLRRAAARRFGGAAGDALAALLGDVADDHRLDAVGDLLVDCGTADELLRRSRRALNGAVS